MPFLPPNQQRQSTKDTPVKKKERKKTLAEHLGCWAGRLSDKKKLTQVEYRHGQHRPSF